MTGQMANQRIGASAFDAFVDATASLPVADLIASAIRIVIADENIFAATGLRPALTWVRSNS
jgi:hypothetical protein